MRAAPTQPHCQAQSPQNISTDSNLGKGECPQATRLEGCRGSGRAAAGSLLEDTPRSRWTSGDHAPAACPTVLGKLRPREAAPRPHQESRHSRNRVLGPGSQANHCPHRGPAFLTGQGDSSSWRGGAPGRRGGRHLAEGWEWGAPGRGLGDLLAAGEGWGPPSREHGGLPPGRPPRRAARLISMGEGRWRGGAAGRAGTSLAGPAGRAETQSASDGGGARPFTHRGGPGSGGEEFPPPGRRIVPGPGGARPPCAPDLEPL